MKGLRNGAIASFIISMIVILIGGFYARNRIPPIPNQVVVEGGGVLFDRETVQRGQDVFHRYGLMDHGSIWGHGTLRGPDFAADTLHRTGQYMRDFYAAAATGAAPQAGAFDALPHERQRDISGRVIEEIHTNRFDTGSGNLNVSAAQAYALLQNRKFYEEEFGAGNPHYGFLPNTVPSAQQRQDLADFFYWTAWAAGTNRPGQTFTYTNSWPADVSVGNYPSGGAVIWSILSILGMFLVLGVVVYAVHRYQFFFGPARGVEAAHRLMETPVTPSQRATAKFFLVSALLFLVQILNGGLLANYTVHPESFYVKIVGQIYPYSWAKTWHVQIAILWIVLAWAGTAAYVAPLIARHEPKGQKLLVNILFWAAFAVVVGSLVGEVLSIKSYFDKLWFWLGHQGWEYLELGRVWQILLFAGLIYWLVIVYRTMGHALKTNGHDENARALLIFYILSAILVVGFFGFGLMYGRTTHMTIADFWRWFVVHIWVESIFEFFGVGIVALFLVTLGLVTAKSALRVAYLTAILVFLGGIPGVAHHYFWFGGPSFWLAIGGMFSALETIPLILLVVRAWMEYRSIRQEGKEFPYRWPLYFLVASSVWNFVGAATFGFIINLPIVNYYEHATYLTSNHAHTALFGVYGMLSIALMLFSWRGLVERRYWHEGILRLSFWGLNFGLFLMFSTSLLPIGILQVWHSYVDGFPWARSNAFWESPIVQAWAQWRIVPDTIVIVFGALPLLWFLISTYPRLRKVGQPHPPTPQP